MRVSHLSVLVGILAPLTLHAQDSRAPFEPIPQISVTGRGEVKVSPDRATIQISVQTRAPTAAAAAAENATKTQAVLAALRNLGLGNDQLSTINYNVNPEQRYEPNREPVVIGYTVTNTILADIQKLNQVGPVIDAAVSRGANMITSLDFYASNTEAARRTAIASAIEKGTGRCGSGGQGCAWYAGDIARDQHWLLLASAPADDDDEAGDGGTGRHSDQPGSGDPRS